MAVCGGCGVGRHSVISATAAAVSVAVRCLYGALIRFVVNGGCGGSVSVVCVPAVQLISRLRSVSVSVCWTQAFGSTNHGRYTPHSIRRALGTLAIVQWTDGWTHRRRFACKKCAHTKKYHLKRRQREMQ